ncbi:MAG: hypothetical protein ACLVBP_16540 [Ruminococcus sp.]
MEASELKQLLPKMSDPVWRLLTEFLALSGMRLGEAIALEDSDVDLSVGEIHVTKTFDSVNKVVTPRKVFVLFEMFLSKRSLLLPAEIFERKCFAERLMYGIDKPKLLCFLYRELIHYYTYNK